MTDEETVQRLMPAHLPHVIHLELEARQRAIARLWKWVFGLGATCVMLACLMLYLASEVASRLPCPTPNAMQLSPTEIRARGSEVYEL